MFDPHTPCSSNADGMPSPGGFGHPLPPKQQHDHQAPSGWAGQPVDIDGDAMEILVVHLASARLQPGNTPAVQVSALHAVGNGGTLSFVVPLTTLFKCGGLLHAGARVVVTLAPAAGTSTTMVARRIDAAMAFGPRPTPSSPAGSFEHAVCSFAPSVVGHRLLKALLLLLAASRVANLDPGEPVARLVAVRGPPRCGKSTLLRAFARVAPFAATAAAGGGGGGGGKCSASSAAATTTATSSAVGGVTNDAATVLPLLPSLQPQPTAGVPGGAQPSAQQQMPWMFNVGAALAATAGGGAKIVVDDAADIAPTELSTMLTAASAGSTTERIPALAGLPDAIVPPIAETLLHVATGQPPDVVGTEGGLILLGVPASDAAGGWCKGPAARSDRRIERLLAGCALEVAMPLGLGGIDDAHVGASVGASTAASSMGYGGGGGAARSDHSHHHPTEQSLAARLDAAEAHARDVESETRSVSHPAAHFWAAPSASETNATTPEPPQQHHRLTEDGLRRRIRDAHGVAGSTEMRGLFGLPAVAAIAHFVEEASASLAPDAPLAAVASLVSSLISARAAFDGASVPTDAHAAEAFEIVRWALQTSEAERHRHDTAASCAGQRMVADMMAGTSPMGSAPASPATTPLTSQWGSLTAPFSTDPSSQSAVLPPSGAAMLPPLTSLPSPGAAVSAMPLTPIFAAASPLGGGCGRRGGGAKKVSKKQFALSLLGSLAAVQAASGMQTISADAAFIAQVAQRVAGYEQHSTRLGEVVDALHRDGALLKRPGHQIRVVGS